jgi:hypothetical protein
MGEEETMRRRMSLVGLALALAFMSARSEGKRVAPFNVDGSGLALHGYDAVSYFEGSTPLAGNPQFEQSWGGAKWRFANASNRDRFAAAPERYAPEFGGYCAKAVSENHTADVDPLAYKIVDDKLYLNYSPKVQKLWEEDIPGRIARANQNWPALH